MKRPKNILKFKFSPERQRTLRSRGVDGACFAGSRNEFLFEEAAMRMKPNLNNVIVKAIGTKRQTSMLHSVMENPLRGAPIIGIGSFPTDIRAKMLAVNIMNRAIDAQTEAVRGKLLNRDYPIWHKVFGGFKDRIRDGELAERPSMLVLSNIDLLSTNHKLEKVRDILEMFDNIPRVVVLTGCCPMEFFATKLHLAMDYGFYLGPDDRPEHINLLDEL
jgi:hypothetical protein